MKRIAIAGNPNSGKSCVFNNLTGGNQRVGNYPGVTVEFTEGTSQFGGEKVQIIDLPGTYSLTAYSQDEVVARDFIMQEKPDVVVNVIDASNLERNLYLTAQLLELQTPMILVLNMYDVAEKKGLAIDAELLAESLGIKVVKTIAVKKEGMDDIKAACLETINDEYKPCPLSYPHELEKILPGVLAEVEKCPTITASYNPTWFAVKLLEDDEIILKELKKSSCAGQIEVALSNAKEELKKHSDEESNTAVVEARYAFAHGIYRTALKSNEQDQKLLTGAIDAVACNRFLGPVLLGTVVYTLFKFTFFMSEDLAVIPTLSGEFVSPIGLFEMIFEYLGGLGEGIQTPWLQSLVVDGIVGGVGGVMGFVPLIFFMFMFLSVLEDSGYIARVAFILDRVLRSFGLQGKSILAMIVSGGLGAGGCAVPGVMATRTMREEKDRLVTILVAPLMNCGAKIPVFAMLTAAFFAENQGEMLFLIWLLSWVFALTFAVLLRKFIIKGEQTPFVMELPVYHIPTLRGVMTDTWNRTYMYIKKAATIILAINVVLWAMIYYPRTDTTLFDAQREAANKTLLSAVATTTFASQFSEEEIESTLAALGSEEGDEADAKYEDIVKAFADDKTPLSKAVTSYNESSIQIDNDEQQAQFSGSIAGKIGMALEPISKLAGFDWRDNIALIGGFAAKEVVVGYLGTVYSMGDVDPEASDSLADRLQNDPEWSRVRAFAMIIFIMIYAPCFVTIAVIKRETNWKWALFSTGYTTVIGFILAVAVFQIGNLIF